MGSNESEGDDVILERLRESASGDAAVRQLRRRYDLLRRDYEELLDRLGDLEDRLADEPPASQVSAPPTATAPATTQAAPGLTDMILAPLLKLRDDYIAAVSGINTVVTGLESLAAGAFKGQHGVPAGAGVQPPVAEAAEAVRAPQSRRMQVDVRGRGFGELLDFQERLSTLDGVARVSINAIDTERATLVVELEGPARPPAED